MKQLLFPTLAAIVAMPAIAQTTPTEMTTPASPEAPMTTPAPLEAPATTPAPVAEAAPAPAPAAAPADPASILKAEFPTYDKDSNGELSKVEFSDWLNKLRTMSPQKQELTAEQETKWLATSFTKADTDKNKTVNLAELTTFLAPKS